MATSTLKPCYMLGYSDRFVSTATDFLLLHDGWYPVHRDIMVVNFEHWAVSASLRRVNDNTCITICLDGVVGISMAALVALLKRIYNTGNADDSKPTNPELDVELGVCNILNFLGATPVTTDRVIADDHSLEHSIAHVYGPDQLTTFKWNFKLRVTVNSYKGYANFQKDVDIFYAAEKANVVVSFATKCVPWIRLANSAELMRSIACGWVLGADSTVIAFAKACTDFIDAHTDKKTWVRVRPVTGVTMVINIHSNGAKFYFARSNTYYLPEVFDDQEFERSPNHEGLGTALYCAQSIWNHGKDAELNDVLKKMSRGDVDAWKHCFSLLHSDN